MCSSGGVGGSFDVDTFAWNKIDSFDTSLLNIVVLHFKIMWMEGELKLYLKGVKCMFRGGGGRCVCVCVSLVADTFAWSKTDSFDTSLLNTVAQHCNIMWMEGKLKSYL